MYNPFITYFYNLQKDHTNNSSTHLTPYIVFTVLLTIFPIVNISCILHAYDYSVPTNLYFLIPSPFSPFPLPAPPIWQTSKCSLYLWLCLCCVCLFCFLDSAYKSSYRLIWEIIWHLSFSVWVIWLSTVPSRFTHVFADSSLWLKRISSYIGSTALSIHLLVYT